MGFIFALVCALAGLLVLARLGPRLHLLEWLAGGIALGLVGGMYAVCLTAWYWGLEGAAIWGGGLAWLALGLLVGSGAVRERLALGSLQGPDGPQDTPQEVSPPPGCSSLKAPSQPRSPLPKGWLLASLIGIALLAVLHSRMATFDGGVLRSQGSAWTDLPLHLAITHTTAEVRVFPPTHPLDAAEPLQYHWGVDLLSAALLVAGNHHGVEALRLAVLGPDLIFSVACFTLLACLARRCGLGPWGTASAVLLAALNGGLGIFLFASQHPHDFAQAFGALPRPPDVLPQSDIYWTGLLRDVLLHSRTSGPALSLWLLAGVLLCANPAPVKPGDKPQESGGTPLATGGIPTPLSSPPEPSISRPQTGLRGFAAGLALGLMPLLNLHVFVGGMAVMTVWLLLERPRGSAWSLAGFALVGPWVLLWLWAHHNGAADYLHASGGTWMGSTHPVRFWLGNVGPLVVLGPWGARFLKRPGQRLTLASLAAFVLGNTFVLTTVWANEKLMLPWHLLACVGAAALLENLAQRGAWGRAVGGCVLALSLATGGASLLHVVTHQTQFYGPQIVGACRYLATQTPPRSVVLCSDGEANPVTVLGGRRLYAACAEIIYDHGILDEPRLALRDRVLHGDRLARWILLLDGVDYVMVSQEAQAQGMRAYLETVDCTCVYRDDGYAVYQTPRVARPVQPVRSPTL